MTSTTNGTTRMTTPTKAAKASRERYVTAFVVWGLGGLRRAGSLRRGGDHPTTFPLSPRRASLTSRCPGCRCGFVLVDHSTQSPRLAEHARGHTGAIAGARRHLLADPLVLDMRHGTSVPFHR